MHFPDPPRREQGENVIPLINIVFLLLIFFMLAGALTATDPFDVEPPETRDGREAERTEDGMILLAADGRLAFEGEELAAEDLTMRLQERLAGAEPPPIKLKADADVSAEAVLDLMDLLRDVGLERLVLLTNPAES
ncbi:biopolymer transport protein ExbD [Natronocella acetinitrilica]|uniref:Biopolymer transport protein ExbD n=1 Tax=Natronocella acetinitrilica TaxID=414046 RepID=A0AAE3G107_9GAMM|nr:biopolymer transporter ExbD [Natronocella acetinitrilica]MCP1673163.1 biopolymer transport protein ExbD [Natronocella acetinitrilica]